MCSDEFSRLVEPHQRYAYDLIVHGGLARYLSGQQREEIRAELYQERGLTLSDGSISNLCDRFLVYHQIALPALEARRLEMLEIIEEAAKDYQGALAALTYLEDNFGHRLDARKLRQDKFRAFTRLASSQEFKDWRASRD
jgi:hypothetical protein